MRLQRADLHLVGVGLGSSDGLRLGGQRRLGALLRIIQVFFQAVVRRRQVRNGGVQFLDGRIGLGQLGFKLPVAIPGVGADGGGVGQLLLQFLHAFQRLGEVVPGAVRERRLLLALMDQLLVPGAQRRGFRGRFGQFITQAASFGRALPGRSQILFQAVIGARQFRHRCTALVECLVGVGELLSQAVEFRRFAGGFPGPAQIALQISHPVGERLLVPGGYFQLLLRRGELLPEAVGLCGVGFALDPGGERLFGRGNPGRQRAVLRPGLVQLLLRLRQFLPQIGQACAGPIGLRGFFVDRLLK